MVIYNVVSLRNPKDGMKMKNKRIMVTGGAGFIGSHIVDSLLEKCEEVIVYDNFSTGTMENLRHVKESPNLKIVKGDILDRDKLKKYMENVDVVSHHAAELEVFTGITDMNQDLRINVEGTLNVLSAAINSRAGKFIYASSSGVYGQAKYTPEDENHPLDPHWPYGVSKLAGEKYCTMAWNLYRFPTVSLRYAIVYGSREWYGRVLTMFIKRCLEGKSPVIFGDGEQTRDFVYVSDVAKAHNLAIRKKNANGKVFNIGSGVPTSINELAKTIINQINPGIKPVYDNPKEGEGSKYQPERKRLIGELKDLLLDISYAKKILGFRPRTSLDAGIKNEVEWAKINRGRWNVRPRV